MKTFDRINAAPASHQFAASRLNAPDRPFVRAEIAGGGADLVYVLDGADAKSETLLAVSKRLARDQALENRRELTVLSEQPIGRGRRDTLPPRFLVTDVDLAVTASDGKDVCDLGHGDDSRVGRADAGLRHGPVRHAVRLFNVGGPGSPAPAAQRASSTRPEPRCRSTIARTRSPSRSRRRSRPGAPSKVRFEIEGDILYRPGGDNYWELGVGPWFPLPDLTGQYYTVHATVKVKKPFLPFAPGKTIRRVAEGDFNVLETRVDKPVQFMVVLAGKYGFDETTENGVTVRVASYGRKNDMGIQKLLKLSHKVIAYYEPFLGKFPFEEFNILEIHSYGFGQAPPGFMFITSEAFSPIEGTVNQLFSHGVNERFSHEIAHQYWGHVVKMPGAEEQWLTESFAEICAGLFVRDLRGKSDFQGLVNGWKWRAKDAADAAPIPLANQAPQRLRPRPRVREADVPPLLQGPLSPQLDPRGDRRRALPEVPELRAGDVPLEVRQHEDRRDRARRRSRRRTGSRFSTRTTGERPCPRSRGAIRRTPEETPFTAARRSRPRYPAGGAYSSGDLDVREDPAGARRVELLFPARDDDGADAVPDQVRDRAGLGHEAVDTEEEREARHGDVADGRERRGERDEPAARHGGRALGREEEDREDLELLAERHVRVRGLRDEERRERQVDRRAVEVEGVAHRHDEADDRLAAAEPLHLLHEERQGGLGRGRAEDDEDLLLDVPHELAGSRGRRAAARAPRTRSTKRRLVA